MFSDPGEQELDRKADPALRGQVHDFNSTLAGPNFVRALALLGQFLEVGEAAMLRQLFEVR